MPTYHSLQGDILAITLQLFAVEGKLEQSIRNSNFWLGKYIISCNPTPIHRQHL